ncbi:MAG: hypothetical protein ABI411_00525 [Tahibacter sp.]
MREPGASAITPAERWLLLVCVLGFGLLAVALGQSNNWDLRNYHWYNGWAWLTGRENRDFAAAYTQTWFNPVLPAALYLLLNSLPAWLGTFALGCAQGLNLIPLHTIARRLLPASLCAHRWIVVVVCVTGLLGANGRGELGATFGDTLVSLPVLLAVATLIARGGLSNRRLLVAGALLGLAVGIKLTTAPLVLGIALALPALARSPRDALRLIGIGAAGAAMMFAISDGWWLWHLWQRYGNPLFPMFGSVFGGDYVPPFDTRDARYLPRSLAEWLFYPLVWAKHPRLVSELWFLDLRIPLLFLGMLGLPLWRRPALAHAAPRALRFVLTAVALGYVGWLILFGYYRYLAVIEMLAPVLLICALCGVFQRSEKRQQFAAVVICTILLLFTRPANWGRLQHYSEGYVEVTLPTLPDLATATVLLVDDQPLAFLAPAFPATTRFVRIGGGMLGPPIPEWRFDADAATHLATAGEPLYVLLGKPQSALVTASLARRNLRLASSECARVQANLLPPAIPIYLCNAQRIASP